MTSSTATDRTPMPPSPCVGICEMDETTGYCRGCARTGEEIAGWRDAPPALREAAWAAIPDRVTALGITVRRLAWEPPEILDFVTATLEEARGTWVLGTYGAVAEVLRSPGAPLDLRREGDTLRAVLPGAALGLRIARGVRAMAWAESPDRPERIVLALPRARLPAEAAAVLTPLGADAEALLPDGAGAERFDIGLGMAEARFTLRTRDAAVLAAMRAAEGRPFPDHLGTTGGPVLAASPVRVIESPLGRAEVAAPIPAPGGVSPDGPHTHLLPGLIARGLAVPPTLALPAAFAAGAIFYPRG